MKTNKTRRRLAVLILIILVFFFPKEYSILVLKFITILALINAEISDSMTEKMINES